MKAIEERARAYAEQFREEYQVAMFKAYLDGADSQKAIAIDKACEIYEKELRQVKRILNEVKDGAGELISVGGSLIQFRKAMEE